MAARQTVEAGVTGDAGTAGFGVYIHWPFCRSKCPYCDFNSHVRSGGIDEPRFLKAYLRELAHFARLTRHEKIRSIFFGGGTPSLMAPKTVETMLAAIADHWEFEPDIEISLEANPSSVEAERFKDLANAGVNRVSLGVQALSDRDLKSLGRLHSVAEAIRALDIAEANFDRISFDLIYARPNQTIADWRTELGKALDRTTGHISLYQLTIEPRTPFWALHKAGKLKIPEPELAGRFYQVTQELCDRAGLDAYEVSNHAKPGQECRHNLIYWNYGEYIGIGPGGHGRLVMDGERRATLTERNPEAWLTRVERDGHGLSGCEAINHRQQADEMLLMGLRLSDGINLQRFENLTGYVVDHSALTDLLDSGLIALDDDAHTLRATGAARVVLNEIVLRVSQSLRLAPS